MSGKVRIFAWSLDPPRFDVAQYKVDSVDALKARRALFPEGTVFRWRTATQKVDPAVAEAFFVEIETWLAEQGKGLVR